MQKDIGLNTNARDAVKGGTPISDGEKAPESPLATFEEAESQITNSPNIAPGWSEQNYTPEIFKESLHVAGMPANLIPPEIQNAIAPALENAIAMAVAPNTAASLLTWQSHAYLPVGYCVTIIFPSQEDPHPHEHPDGTIYMMTEKE